MDRVDIDSSIALSLDSVERWTIFSRLQELAVSCQCTFNQPLRVEVDTPMAMLQVWSVIQQVTRPQSELITHLERCWKQPIT